MLRIVRKIFARAGLSPIKSNAVKTSSFLVKSHDMKKNIERSLVLTLPLHLRRVSRWFL